MARGFVALGGSVAAVTLVTGVVYGLRTEVPVLSLGVVYLLAVLPVALLWGRAWGIAVAVGSMLAFNFFFLPPQHTFQLADRANWLALAVYVVTALVVSDRAAQARKRAAAAEQREREEALLAEAALALLQGEQLAAQLDQVGAATARVLGVTSARIRVGSAGAEPDRVEIPLVAEGQNVAVLSLPAGTALDQAVQRRFVPALASLVVVALDRAKLEREALEAERLRMSDSMKTTILRAVSHDLRSPLTAIRLAAESLASEGVDLDDEGRRRQLETVRFEARRLERLVANLLDLSRLEADAAAPERNVVAVDDLIALAVRALPAADESRVDVALPEGIPLVELDPGQVERALVNVIENALRVTAPDGRVGVLVTSDRAETVIAVHDHGPGIAEADAARVFAPFESVQSPAARQGTGLGLAIAKGFTEANGGRIWVESRPGEGAVFRLAFPLVAAAVESAR